VDELARVDRYCDDVPRSAATVEEIGSLRLFVPTVESFHPWYARPSGTGPVTADDLRTVLRRQHLLGLPRSVEWIDGRPAGVAAVAAEAGLRVSAHPVLVASPEELAPFEPEVDVRVIGPRDDLARVEAVATVGFATTGTAVGGPGTEALDAAVETDQARLATRAARVAAGRPVVAAAFVDGQPVARGGCTVVGDVAEITGVATLPSFRRQGLGAAVTAVLGREALRRGARLLWLSAQDDAVARVYSRLGFREVGSAGTAEL
jgi:ribosomal protein S18 acetylase RimI-like enzyme